jgi:hypothetical protein
MMIRNGNLEGELRKMTDRSSTDEQGSHVLPEVRRKVVDASGRLAVSLNEAAETIGISRRSLENYIAANVLPSRKLGKRRIILVRDLEKFLRSDQPSVGRKRGREKREGIL